MTNVLRAIERYRILNVEPTFLGQTQVIVELPNGYRASVIGGPVRRPLYGRTWGIEEVGIMNSRGELIYHTPVAPHDAVRRYGSVEEIPGILEEIAALDPATEYPTGFRSFDEEED